MAYERQYYTNGDVLDARQLNHMETGIKENSDNVSKLSEEIGNQSGLTNDLKTAFINYYTHVMPNFDDTNGLSYVNAILTALGAETRGESGGEEPDIPDEPTEPDIPEDATLTSISVIYTGGDVTVGTTLSDLTGITVTATYSNGTTKEVTGYTLSGEIAEGNNIITVSYGGKKTTFTVKGVAESGGDDEDIHDGYISDGLELRLDAIRNTADGHDASAFPDWYDVSGNEYDTIRSPSADGTCYDTYYSVKTTSGTNIRLQQKIKSTDLIGKMADAFTVEVVFQPENSNDTGSTFAVDNGENYILIKQSGQFRKMGNATLYGTAMTNENVIRHCTYVYDGSTIKMYHDGVLDTEIEGTMDISAQTFVEFWGSQDWAQVVTGTFNAGRIYTRALTAEEILTNYNNDIARFGTSNGEVA